MYSRNPRSTLDSVQDKEHGGIYLYYHLCTMIPIHNNHICSDRK